MTLTLPALLTWTASLPMAMRRPLDPVASSAWHAVIPAVVADVHETVVGSPPDARLLDSLRLTGDARTDERLAWIMAACHVCWHPALRQRDASRDPTFARLMIQELPAVASLVPVERLDQDEDRREELVRRCLRALGRRFDGETATVADERLAQVDSIERQYLMRVARERQEELWRAELLRRKAEEEAASKVSRE